MGTETDANNEWIELYNLSGTSTDVTGWTLVAGDSTNPSLFTVLLSGTLSPHGVGVLERTDDDTLPGVTAFQIYTGVLKNEGETLTLTLKDAEGNVSDEAVGGTDWAGVGGSNTPPKKTAQRTMTGSWVTAAPTPGAENAQEDDPLATTTETTMTASTNNSSGGSSGKGSGASSKKSAPKPKTPEVPNVLSLSIDAPKIAYVNQEVSFEAIPSGVGKTVMNSLSYTWNFGDTYTASSKNVSHIFRYPGEYIVVVEGMFAKQRAMVRHEVKVLPVSFTLSKMPNGDVEVKNNASYEVDLGGFSLRGQIHFTFPKNTFIKSKGMLTVPVGRVGNAPALSLHDAQNAAVVTYGATVATPRATVPAPQRQVSVVTLSPQEETEAVVTPSSTIIRIGTPKEEIQEGILSRLFARITRMFGP
jgi:hypothetical protein